MMMGPALFTIGLEGRGGGAGGGGLSALAGLWKGLWQATPAGQRGQQQSRESRIITLFGMGLWCLLGMSHWCCPTL